jgi:drug/metabolite transporter (DMT)-like permease
LRGRLFVDLQPVWAAILGTLFLKERLSSIEIGGVALVTVGGIVTVANTWSQSGANATGDLLSLAGGVCGATYLMIGRKVRMQFPWVHYMFAVYAISAAWLLLYGILSVHSIPTPAQGDLILIFCMAVGPGILGHGLLNYSIRHMKGYIVNAALLGEPVLATLMAYWLFREMPDRFFFAGAILIFIGLALVLKPQQLQEE